MVKKKINKENELVEYLEVPEVLDVPEVVKYSGVPEVLDVPEVVEEYYLFITLEQYGIIRNIQRGKFASFKVGIKNDLEPKLLKDWDWIYEDFYNKKGEVI